MAMKNNCDLRIEVTSNKYTFKKILKLCFKSKFSSKVIIIIILLVCILNDFLSSNEAVDLVHRLSNTSMQLHAKDSRGENVVDGQPQEHSKPTTKKPMMNLQGFKKILYWNDVYGRVNFDLGFEQEPFLTNKCQVNQCYATNDRYLFNLTDIDAVLWNMGSRDRSIPYIRSPHTVYILFMVEHPSYVRGDLNIYNDLFNWTYTYRRESDLRIPYGSIKELEPDQSDMEDVRRDYAAGKTKSVVWLVSHCKTWAKREKYVKTLQNFITVDVFGSCGPYKCDNLSVCMHLFNTEYKFYLAFENNLCKDYITEKLFRTLRMDILPVVFGSSYEDYGMPPNSYIDILDFESIADLAEYLRYLDGNDTAYNEYFSWKGKYRVTPASVHHGRSFCQVCERLHTMYPEDSNSIAQNQLREIVDGSDPRSYYKVYDNLYKWWIEEANCIWPDKDNEFNEFILGSSKTEIRSANFSRQGNLPLIADRPNKKWKP